MKAGQDHSCRAESQQWTEFFNGITWSDAPIC